MQFGYLQFIEPFAKDSINMKVAMKNLRIVVCVLTSLCGVLYGAEIDDIMVVDEAPPIERVEIVPERPSDTDVWISGHWKWENPHWVWVDGFWTAPPSLHVHWENGYWVFRDNHWQWTPGRWVINEGKAYPVS